MDLGRPDVVDFLHVRNDWKMKQKFQKSVEASAIFRKDEIERIVNFNDKTSRPQHLNPACPMLTDSHTKEAYEVLPGDLERNSTVSKDIGGPPFSELIITESGLQEMLDYQLDGPSNLLGRMGKGNANTQPIPFLPMETNQGHPTLLSKQLGGDPERSGINLKSGMEARYTYLGKRDLHSILNILERANPKVAKIKLHHYDNGWMQYSPTVREDLLHKFIGVFSSSFTSDRDIRSALEYNWCTLEHSIGDVTLLFHSLTLARTYRDIWIFVLEPKRGPLKMPVSEEIHQMRQYILENEGSQSLFPRLRELVEISRYETIPIPEPGKYRESRISSFGGSVIRRASFSNLRSLASRIHANATERPLKSGASTTSVNLSGWNQIKFNRSSVRSHDKGKIEEKEENKIPVTNSEHRAPLRRIRSMSTLLQKPKQSRDTATISPLPTILLTQVDRNEHVLSSQSSAAIKKYDFIYWKDLYKNLHDQRSVEDQFVSMRFRLHSLLNNHIKQEITEFLSVSKGVLLGTSQGVQIDVYRWMTTKAMQTVPISVPMGLSRHRTSSSLWPGVSTSSRLPAYFMGNVRRNSFGSPHQRTWSRHSRTTSTSTGSMLLSASNLPSGETNSPQVSPSADKEYAVDLLSSNIEYHSLMIKNRSAVESALIGFLIDADDW